MPLVKASSGESGIVIPSDIRTSASDDDYIFAIDGTTSQLYKITKANLLAGLSSSGSSGSSSSGSSGSNSAKLLLVNSLSDTSSNPHIITVVGSTAISTTEAKIGNSSIFFNGNGSYLYTPITSDLNLLVGDFTIECWYYPLSVSNNNSIVGQWQQTAGDGGFVLYAPGSTIDFYFGAYSEINPFLSGGTLAINTWTHIAVTRGGSTFTLWVNGNSMSNNSSAAIRSLPAVNLSFGNYYNSGGTLGAAGSSDLYGYLQARISDVCLYTSAFTPPVSW